MAATNRLLRAFSDAALRLFGRGLTPSSTRTEQPSTLPLPPADWRNVDGWNSYWRASLECKRQDLLLAFDIRPVDAVLVSRRLERLMRRKHHRVLIVGNGITLIPRVFCHAGFQATALDVSSVATEFARSYEPTADDWKLLFQLDERGDVGQHFKRFARTGGTLDFVCGDLFDFDATPGPFDVVWSSRSLQGFSDEDMTQAIRRLDARLEPHGECHVLVQNSGEKYQRIVSTFEQLGYTVNPGADRPGKSLHIGIGSG